jgi:hypothetical protein
MEPPKVISETTAGQAPGGKDRRRCRRYTCEGFAEAVVIHPESLLPGEVRDISETGCYLATKAHLHLERLDGVDLRFGQHQTSFRTFALQLPMEM